MRGARVLVVAAVALIGGASLVSAALDHVLSPAQRLLLIAGVLSLGGARRILQERLHGR